MILFLSETSIRSPRTSKETVPSIKVRLTLHRSIGVLRIWTMTFAFLGFPFSSPFLLLTLFILASIFPTLPVIPAWNWDLPGPFPSQSPCTSCHHPDCSSRPVVQGTPGTSSLPSWVDLLWPGFPHFPLIWITFLNNPKECYMKR